MVPLKSIKLEKIKMLKYKFAFWQLKRVKLFKMSLTKGNFIQNDTVILNLESYGTRIQIDLHLKSFSTSFVLRFKL